MVQSTPRDWPRDKLSLREFGNEAKGRLRLYRFPGSEHTGKDPSRINTAFKLSGCRLQLTGIRWVLDTDRRYMPVGPYSQLRQVACKPILSRFPDL
jgi:hypothetical protein